MATMDPWTWRFLVSKVFLVGEFMHVGQAMSPTGVTVVQGTRAG